MFMLIFFTTYMLKQTTVGDAVVAVGLCITHSIEFDASIKNISTE